MSVQDTYLTISQRAEGLFKDRGSKFIAIGLPVQNETDIKQSLALIRSEHNTARHHCYAYKLGPDGAMYRTNDDGEPSGTAGKPILGQLTKYELTNILVVVVRYFGGTKLGVGGLINAYKSAAAECIERVDIIQKTVCDQFQLKFDYPQLKEVEQLINKLGIAIVHRDFRESCKLECEVRKSELEQALTVFRNIHGVDVTG